MPEQIKRIDIGDLTEAVTTAVHRAVEAQKQSLWKNPRIVIGIWIEPHYPPAPGTGPSTPT